MREADRGTALVVVMMAVALLTALGSALTLATITETAIAANYRDATEAFYAAEAAVEFAKGEVASMSDWSEIVVTPGRSAFVDGPPGGRRTVGATTVDLRAATSDVNAAAPGASGATEADWLLYAYGRFRDLVPSSPRRSQIYVVVWVADRSEEEASTPQVVSILGQAYGGHGSRRTVEVIVERDSAGLVQTRRWREWR
ncbi:MAG: pilus assembly PilX N-terminal domain-containing protein [Acidobacteria bacterium]|nr:pilus assembly PilX N-terminal domain-containing protein [Acidobacteriota bacterium]